MRFMTRFHNIEECPKCPRLEGGKVSGKLRFL